MKLLAIALLAISLHAQSNLLTPTSIMPKADHSSAGVFRIWDSEQGHYIGITVAGTVGSNVIWNWPAADAAGCLMSDGSANLTLGSCGGVSNGFFVTGQSTVGPPSTAVGLQVYHDPATHSSFIKSYNASNTVTGINITGFANFNQRTDFQGGLSLGSTPTITNAFSGAALQLIGSTTGNGNLVFVPGSVSGNSSSVFTMTRADGPAVYIVEASGTTTGNAFEVRDSTGLNTAGHIKFKILPDGDVGCPNCVVAGSLFGLADVTSSLGASSNRYLKLWVQDLDFSGTITGDVMTLTTPQTVTGDKTFNAQIHEGTIDTHDVGTVLIPFKSMYARTSLDSTHINIHDPGLGSDLTSGFYNFSAAANATTIRMDLQDNGSNNVFSWITNLAGAPYRRTISYYTFTPNASGTNDLGQGSASDNSVTSPLYWKNLWLSNGLWMGGAQVLDSSRNLTVNSCSGCTGVIANGFLINNKTAVSPPTTAMGWQAWYDPTLHTTNWLSYDAASTLAPINISASVINLPGTPRFSATGSGPFQIDTPSSTNGNLLINLGNVTGNSSVYINPSRPDQPDLILATASGTTTGNSIEVRNSSGAVKWKVIAPGDAGCPACMVSGDIFGQSNLNNSVGGSSNRWLKGWFQDLDFSGTITGDVMTLTTAQTVTGDKTFNAQIHEGTINTHDVGTVLIPFKSVYARTSLDSTHINIHDPGLGSDLTSGFYNFSAAANATTIRMDLQDNGSNNVFSWITNLAGAPYRRTISYYTFTPNASGTNDLGQGSASDNSVTSPLYWKNLWLSNGLWMAGTQVLDSSRNLTVNSCSGCGGGTATNGFITVGMSNVGPPNTNVGLQEWFEPTVLQSHINSYDASHNVSTLFLQGGQSPATPNGGGVWIGTGRAASAKGGAIYVGDSPAYSSVKAYNLNDYVTSGGTNYISLANSNTNNTPPNATWWQPASIVDETIMRHMITNSSGLGIYDGSIAAPETSNLPSFVINRVGSTVWDPNNDCVACIHYMNLSDTKAGAILQVEGRESNTATWGQVGFASTMWDNSTVTGRSMFAAYLVTRKYHAPGSDIGVEIDTQNLSGTDCSLSYTSAIGGGACVGVLAVGYGTNRQTAAFVVDSAGNTDPNYTSTSPSGSAFSVGLEITGNGVFGPDAAGIRVRSAVPPLIAQNNQYLRWHSAGGFLTASGTSASLVSGDQFQSWYAGRYIVISGNPYLVASWTSGTSLTLSNALTCVACTYTMETDLLGMDSSNQTVLNSFAGQLFKVGSSTMMSLGTGGLAFPSLANISATGTSPLQLIGSSTTNGDIVLTAGNVPGNAAVVAQGPRDYPSLVVKGIGVAGSSPTVSTVMELRDGNGTAQAWWLGAGDATCPNCATMASIFPKTDGISDLGSDSLKYRYLKAYNGQFGLPPLNVPGNAYLQLSQSGLTLMDVDAYSAGTAGLLLRSAGGSYAFPTAVVANAQVGSVSARAFDGASWSSSSSAALTFLANENWGPFNHGMDMNFATTAAGQTSRVVRFTMSSAGLIPGASHFYTIGSPTFTLANGYFDTITVGSCSGCGGGGGGVSSVNGLTGAVTLAGTLNQIATAISGGTITFSLPQNLSIASTVDFAAYKQNGAYVIDPSGNANVVGLNIGGTIVSPAGGTSDGVLSCPAGQHINAIVVSQGLIRGHSCS